MKKNTTSFLLLTSIALAMIFSSCGGASDSSPVNPPIDQSGPQATPEEELHPLSKKVIYAYGWESATIRANSARTKVTIAAHFETDRNACGKDAYGPLDLQTWNDFAQSMNQAIVSLFTQPQTAPTEYCTPSPQDYSEKFIDESLSVKTIQGDLFLFENKEGELCTRIADKAIADQLTKATIKIIVAADREDCPNGWGSER